MSFTLQQRNPERQAAGFVVVVLLHVGMIYALVTGLGTNIVEVIKAPLETKIIQEVKPPPDVPPPPPPPKLAAPPPPYIPPPEIQIAQPPPPTPVATVAVVAPPAPQAPPVLRAAPPAPAAVPDSEVSARPISGGAPAYPPRMLDQGRTGHVDVTCDVELDGTTSNCTVTAVTGGPAFADSALEYVKAARYRPRIRNGAAVREAHHTFSIGFALK